MNQDINFDTIDNKEKSLEKDDAKYPLSSSPSRSSLPMIAGFLLLIGGSLAIVNWLSIFSLDATNLESFFNLPQLKQAYPNITAEEVLSFLRTCAVIGCIVSVFSILGGILSLKRKMWGIALACSIIGLFSIGILFTSSFLSFIAMIILIVSKKEF